MKNIIKIITISKPLHRLAFLLGFLIFLGSCFALVAPLFSKLIVDEIVKRIQHHQGDSTRLLILILLAFSSNLLNLLITVISERFGDHFAGRLRQFLTEKFYGKMLTLPQTYFDTEISGKIVNQLNRGIASIYGFLNTATNFILPTLIQSIFTIFVLAYYNLPIALCTFILFPVYLSLSYYSTKKWGQEEAKKNIIEDYTRGRIQEVISNIRLVKSFTSELHEYGILSKNLTKINTIYARQSKIFHVFDFFRGLSLHIILFLINLIVFYNTFLGKLSIGEMVLILQLVNQARMPLFAMSFILTQIQIAETGSKEYFSLLSLPSTEKYTNKTYDHVINPSLTFSHVSFQYEKSTNMVLDDISFTLYPNQSVALVGHSGVGKSTIINLLLKFYSPTKGNILLNDQSYSSLDHQNIRNNISLVFQESELFSSTIRENITYGKKDASTKEIIDALKKANAYEFVNNLSQGIESEVGERGIRLSGGQKQRIQIARAILKNAPILILDEATSSLDAKSEHEVQIGLENLMKEKLVIIIAHRFSTIQNVNTIIVLDEGKIINTGSPQELSKTKGIYADLLHYQIEGNKKLLASFDIY